ncbi:MAG: hypothetical protein JNM86_07475 [Phycisphaerae bacterium]|nr:hypothetical protein [Phycisphaerae bacterium]
MSTENSHPQPTHASLLLGDLESHLEHHRDGGKLIRGINTNSQINMMTNKTEINPTSSHGAPFR